MRKLRWDLPEQPPPKHPYRDSFLMYLAFALAIVGVAWATGGNLGRALTWAGFFFVVALAWSWTGWRRRLRARERQQADGPPPSPPAGEERP